ncbi:hypothetical protein [Lentzea atacamensis]|uniref:hypothetical protein n=1 Tax=Lentzea atacamensis TaxID=531938 RepID=UPI001C023DD5|nr:hypothetical protein [Lentzea atacamensis]
MQTGNACQAVLILFRDDNDRSGEAATLDSLGNLARHAGDHRGARAHYRQASTSAATSVRSTGEPTSSTTSVRRAPSPTSRRPAPRGIAHREG